MGSVEGQGTAAAVRGSRHKRYRTALILSRNEARIFMLASSKLLYAEKGRSD
jgi:hypothetical protein